MASDSHTLLPVLHKETVFSDWQSDAKAYLRGKEVFVYCTATFDAAKHEEVKKDKCAGILWSMLSPDVRSLVRQHEDDPKALWAALPSIFAPKQAGQRFNAYKNLTSIRLKEGEGLLSLVGRVSEAVRFLKSSRPDSFTLDKADEELHAVVLLMALPDSEPAYATLKAPFEQSHDALKVAAIEQAFTSWSAFRAAGNAGDSGQSNPLSGAAMITSANPPSAALEAASGPSQPCQSVILTNVLFVPALSHNLISTTYLSVHHDYTVLMKENYILFKRNGEVYFVADISEQGQAFQQPPARPLPAPRVPSPAASSDDEINFLRRAPPPPSPPPAGDAPLHPPPSPPPPQSPIGVAARRAAAGIHRVPAPPRRAPAPAAAPPRRTMAEIFEEIPEDLSDDELLLKS
ncbi:unnamed protein product [Mycena citricolor]|uniref:Uncharacterized protein n=1 Tax=Mycena citricolor TaxID=2018698 RepID=A0AAD2K2V3_9AGAR|nr:unnamed protein product [Mycena citricolor]